MVISINDIIVEISGKIGRHRTGEILYASWVSQLDEKPFEVKLLVLPNGKLKPLATNRPSEKQRILSYTDEEAEDLTFPAYSYREVGLSRIPKYPW
jgi:hypothetical protein